MAYDFFVSYSTRDKAFVDALVHQLEETGYRCWYAPRDIEPGTSWPAAIATALQASSIMLLVFSSSANDSEEIARELTLASGNRLPVIPVRLENIMPNAELAYHLSNRHWLDVFDLELETAIKRVEEGLERYLSTSSARREAGAESEAMGAAPAGKSGQSGQPAQSGQPDRAWSENFAAPSRPLSGKLPLKARLSALLLVLLLAGGAAFYFSRAESVPDDPTAQLLEPAEKSGVYFYQSSQGLPVTVFVLPLAPVPVPDHPYLEPPDEFLVAFSGSGGKYDGRIFRCKRDLGRSMRFIALIGGNNQMIFSVDASTRGVVFDPESKKEFQVKGVLFNREREVAQELIRLYRDKRKWNGFN